VKAISRTVPTTRKQNKRL